MMLLLKNIFIFIILGQVLNINILVAQYFENNSESLLIFNKDSLFKHAIIDSIILYSNTDSELEQKSIIKYRYDNSFNIISETEREWHYEWINKYITYYSYGSNSMVVEKIQKYWALFNWVDKSKIVYTYNSSNQLTNEIYFNHDGNNWESIQENVYEYFDEKMSNYILKMQLEGSWINIKKEIYQYNNYDSIEIIDYYDWEEDSWVIKHRDIYSYDSNYRNISILYKNFISDSFNDSRKTEYLYEDGRMKEILSRVYENDIWINRWKTSFKYYFDSDYYEAINKSWENGKWLNSFMYSYKFDKYNMIYEQTHLNWDNENWRNYTKLQYFLRNKTSMIKTYKNKRNNEMLIIFPNPSLSTNIICLNFSLDYFSNVSLELVNNLGILETCIFSGYKDIGEHIIRFNSNKNLPTGTYWVRMIIDGEEQAVKPLVIMR